jgi:hypothetical protein
MNIPEPVIMLPLMFAILMSAWRFYWLRASRRGVFPRVLAFGVIPAVVFFAYALLRNAGLAGGWVSPAFALVSFALFAVAVWLQRYKPRGSKRARSVMG